MAELSVQHVVIVAGICWVAFKILQALYNISPLHPLSKVPGPRLAAATYWPEFYHDVILTGRYTHAIKKMHDEYGEWNLGPSCFQGPSLADARVATRPDCPNQPQ